MSCGCSSGDNTPPSSTPYGGGTGASNPFTGNAVVGRNPCTPAPCPSPPVSDQTERPPYCPLWVKSLIQAVKGKLMIIKNDCLYTLKSKCSGFLWYDSGTEEVSVQAPPFVSATPSETQFGFLAKAVPTVRRICDDNADECANEIVQELAAQIMDQASCGQLVIARMPLCNELPADQAASANRQVRFDFLDPATQKGCQGPVSFLVKVPGKRGPKGAEVDCDQWVAMTKIRMPRSQWGVLTNPDDIAKSKIAVLVPVGGGTTEDPCYELRFVDSAAGSLPMNPNNCDIAVFSGKDTPEAGWKAVPKGLTRHYLDTPVEIYSQTAPGTTSVTMPQYPENPCGEVRAILQIRASSGSGPSGASISHTLTINGWETLTEGTINTLLIVQTTAKMTSNVASFVYSNNSVSSVQGFTVHLLGYEY